MKKNRKVPQRIIPLRDFEFLCNDYSAAFLDFSHFKCKNFSFQVQSNTYFSRQKPGLRAYFKNIIGEITDMLPDPKDHNLDKKLDDTYLLGYYHQRSALTRKKEAADNETKTVTEDM